MSKWGLWLSRRAISAKAPDTVSEIRSQNTELLTELTLEFFKQVMALKSENLMLRGKLLNK
jgi:hypothetical protein